MAENSPYFPLGLCVATLTATGLGLWAALLGVQWGPGPLRPDALPLAWAYVNIALCGVWFLVWPAAVYRGPVPGASLPDRLLFQLAVLAVGAFPALAVGGWLSAVGLFTAAQMVTLQAGWALLVLGALALGSPNQMWRVVMACALALAYLGLPALAYLQLEFLGGTATHWQAAIPAVAVWATANAGSLGWGVGPALAAAGLLMLAWARRNMRQTSTTK